MRPRHLFAALVALAAATCASPATADKASDTLRIVWRNAIPNVDPYYNQLQGKPKHEQRHRHCEEPRSGDEAIQEGQPAWLCPGLLCFASLRSQ
jgi:ligand-binding sensor protein